MAAGLWIDGVGFPAFNEVIYRPFRGKSYFCLAEYQEANVKKCSFSSGTNDNSGGTGMSLEAARVLL